MGASNGQDRLDRSLESIRLPAEPLARLDAIRRLREHVEALELDGVAEARSAGVTWKAIGLLYGLSKQGAQQRFRPPAAPVSPT